MNILCHIGVEHMTDILPRGYERAYLSGTIGEKRGVDY